MHSLTEKQASRSAGRGRGKGSFPVPHEEKKCNAKKLVSAAAHKMPREREREVILRFYFKNHIDTQIETPGGEESRRTLEEAQGVFPSLLCFVLVLVLVLVLVIVVG